ncbi:MULTISPECIES: FecR family protein [Proteiniphilum]|jgi:ferric-dicitrate binding protein FerR (iron transport regulator)|uniref:FecR family protein n=1 Tax=Proteiniphilum TaxID=294702 RepID=UPI001EEB133F|nr:MULTISPECIES: FecR family protein [Proteiniphilum]MDD2247730.1 FecR domain-containing protein [Proteiniphilum sp.]MDD4416881.1 FecR domain-containing protein [Proteiniphilum sp.]ULB34479.1 FecR domain-containing protein [Proteiniphilum propionicum]
MQFNRDDNNFIRFLKDEKFIEWKLFPTDELNKYWEEFLLQFPDKRKDIKLAEKHFRHIKLSSYKQSPGKKQEAAKRLEKSLRRYYIKNNVRRFAFAAAACAAVLVLSLLYLQEKLYKSRNQLITSSEYIVGNELKQEDIMFITGNETASFQHNIDIQISSEKTAQIRSEYQDAEEISIEQHTMNKLIVPYGKQSRITLADGTQVWLNSGTTLEFPSSFTKNKREVYLTGEMYIEVAPDKNRSFYVHTSDFNVRVYGTKFNASSYAGSPASVVLVEGSIGLQSDDGKQELRLSPDEQAVYSDNGTFQTKRVNVQPFISWKDGYLTFEDTPVTEALKQIERYYNLSFNYGDEVSFQGITCTGKIILSDNLDNVMTALTLISAMKYKKKDKLIYIYKK